MKQAVLICRCLSSQVGAQHGRAESGESTAEQHHQPVIKVALEAVLPDGSSSRFDVQQVLHDDVCLLVITAIPGFPLCHMSTAGTICFTCSTCTAGAAMLLTVGIPCSTLSVGTMSSNFRQDLCLLLCSNNSSRWQQQHRMR